MFRSLFVPLLLLCCCFVSVSAYPKSSLFERVADDILKQKTAAAASVVGGSPSKFKVSNDTVNGALPKFSSLGKFYVSGVSSGGYMAGQLHLAYSSEVAGAGIFAAGPWNCATGLLERALSACTDDSAALDLGILIDGAVDASATGLLDPLTNIQNSPVWIFHGLADATVKEPIVDAAYRFYQNFGANVSYVNNSQANHAWISPLGQNDCLISATPYTSRCGAADPPADMLSHILGRPLAPPNDGSLTGQLSPFSQDMYTLERWALDAADLSMDTTGYVYVPAACENNSTTCDVVMVLHGCEQSVSLVGMDLIQQAHMNEYADTNNLIIVYPQTIVLEFGVVLNPKACWDWWGYLADDELYASRGSYQMEVLMGMVRSLKA